MSIQKSLGIKQDFGKLEVGLLGFFWLCLTHHLLHIHRTFLRSPSQQKNFVKTFKLRSEIVRQLFAFVSTNWVIPCFSDLTLEVTCKFSGTGSIQIHHFSKESHSCATQSAQISSKTHLDSFKGLQELLLEHNYFFSTIIGCFLCSVYHSLLCGFTRN